MQQKCIFGEMVQICRKDTKQVSQDIKKHASGMNFQGGNQTIYIEKAEKKNTFF